MFTYGKYADSVKGESSDAEKVDEKRERNKEASRRFRERKKATEKALTEENALLRDEMEVLRRKLAGTGLDVTSVVSDMQNSMRVAVSNLIQGLPEALVPTIQKALKARRTVAESVAGVIRELPRLIPPIAFSEIQLTTFMTWLALQRQGVEPDDPVQREIYHMMNGGMYKEKPIDEGQVELIRNFFSDNEERIQKAIVLKRRLRKLFEEAASIGPELETTDSWLLAEFEKSMTSILYPEQIAGRFAWTDAHLPMLQDAIIGYRFELAPGDSAAVSPSLNLGSSATPSPAPIPPPAAAAAAAAITQLPDAPVAGPSTPTAASPLPAALTPSSALPHPAPARKRGAGEPSARRARAAPHAPAPAPAPAGAGIPPDLLRDLIREAVAKELAHFLEPSASSPAPPAPPPGPALVDLAALFGPPTPDIGLDPGGLGPAF